LVTRKRGCAALGGDDRAGPEGGRGAHDGAEVVRIGDTVEGEDEGTARGLGHQVADIHRRGKA
jgi:hypothetical protein